MSTEISSSDRQHKISKVYGAAQSAILCIFTGLYFLDSGAYLLVPEIAGTIGATLCVVGLLFMLAAFTSIRDTIQIAPEPKSSGHLVTKGIYRYFRHPIYTGILALVVGLFLRKPTTLIAISSLCVIVFLLVKVRFEEKLLLLRYSEYEEYQKKAWGIIPWF